MTVISAWWRLNIRFKDPVGDRVGVELFFLTQLSLGCQSSCQQTSRQLETRWGRESHTRPRGPWETPDGVDPNIMRTRKTQRDGHNSGVKIWSLCSVSSTLSHAKPWTTFSNPCNIVRGKYIWKEVFLRLYPASFLAVSSSCVFLRASLLLSRYDTANEYITPRLLGNYKALCSSFRLFTFIPYQILERPIRSKGSCVFCEWQP